MNKKEIKQFVHDNGYFLNFPVEVNSQNEVDESGMFRFSGLASSEVINANGYGIRKDAWKPAIAGYMNNPIILFQHDMERALGLTRNVMVTERGLEVVGDIRDEADKLYAGGNIKAGVYRMLSTGHITHNFEFQNKKKIMTKEEMMSEINKKGYGEWVNDWDMYVTELEFLEWSIVGLGSVRNALKTNSAMGILCNFYSIKESDIMSKNLTSGVQLNNEEVVQEELENVVENTTVEQVDVVEGENPTPAETNSIVSIEQMLSLKVEKQQESFNSFKNEVKEGFKMQVELFNELSVAVNELSERLNKAAGNRSFVHPNQVNGEGPTLEDLLRR